MLAKIYYIGEGADMFDESTPYEGDLLYIDLAADHWSTKYIYAAKQA
jgi:hypothetical protein